MKSALCDKTFLYAERDGMHTMECDREAGHSGVHVGNDARSFGLTLTWQIGV